jgi:hypothetical protein
VVPLRPALAQWPRGAGGLEGCGVGGVAAGGAGAASPGRRPADRLQGFYEAVVTQGMADYNAGRPPFQDLEGAWWPPG